MSKRRATRRPSSAELATIDAALGDVLKVFREVPSFELDGLRWVYVREAERAIYGDAIGNSAGAVCGLPGAWARKLSPRQAPLREELWCVNGPGMLELAMRWRDGRDAEILRDMRTVFAAGNIQRSKSKT